MITNPRTPTPIGTAQYPYSVSLPFNPDAPFAAGSLGCLMNTGAAADPDVATYRHLVSAGNYSSNDQAAGGSLMPLANPSDLAAGYYWTEWLEPADFTIIKPYLVLFSSSAHTALAAAASADGITAKLSFYLAHHASPPRRNEPCEYEIEYKGTVTLKNSAGRVPATTRCLPTGAQYCYSATITPSTPAAITLTADGTDIATGALRLRIDQEGAAALITRVSSVTASAGVGWLRRHM